MATIPADTSIQPFKVDVAEADLDDLRERLTRTRWPDARPGESWAAGVPKAYLGSLVDYWTREFDWRAQEARLNASHSSGPRSTTRSSTFSMPARASPARSPSCSSTAIRVRCSTTST